MKRKFLLGLAILAAAMLVPLGAYADLVVPWSATTPGAPIDPTTPSFTFNIYETAGNVPGIDTDSAATEEHPGTFDLPVSAPGTANVIALGTLQLFDDAAKTVLSDQVAFGNHFEGTATHGTETLFSDTETISLGGPFQNALEGPNQPTLYTITNATTGNSWTYAVWSDVPEVVPLAPSVLLFVSGLVGLVAFGWRRKKA